MVSLLQYLHHEPGPLSKIYWKKKEQRAKRRAPKREKEIQAGEKGIFRKIETGS